MATALPFAVHLEPNAPRHHSLRRRPPLSLTPLHFTPSRPNLPPLSPQRHNLSLTFITSSTSPSSPPPSPTTSTSTHSTDAVPPSSLTEQFRPTRFLTDQEYSSLLFLHDFTYACPVKSGNLLVRAMRSEEIDETVGLLAESFADSMVLPGGYLTLLRFLVRQYLLERRSALPHAVTLVGFYEEEGEGGDAAVLAGTVEVVFGRKGSNASPPSPVPPRDMPYICNMTVREDLRRRGIGWNLLKASEELILKMCTASEVYLHCRLIDTAPFNMYIKAGYRIVKTDSILVLLLLQRRKHLMCKEIIVLESPSESDDLVEDEVAQ
ncbi:hypothetical protein MLD38_024302 [Melastoma candidum]|uniref:Uncharacterized protein n=1 Tax=Melastoma candidum TaxID=119954 RepID=A0ACB9NUV3_9MYRT|nr:hypothetical protein MLD38_024302 [Melastoma candidum]